MKRHAQIAKSKTLRRRERSEFEILEAYFNEGHWDPGPFSVYAKQVSIGVGTSDHAPPPISAVKARLRYLSNKRWPKSRHENSIKPLLVRSPREKEDEVEAVLVLREVPAEGEARSSSGVCGTVGREIEVEVQPQQEEDAACT